MIENSIMRTLSTDDSIMYRLSCDCMDPECDMIIELEKDECGFVFLNLYKSLEWSSYWGVESWYKRMWRRITGAFRVLFTGYIKVEGTLVMREHQLDGFMEALKEGREFIRSKE